MRTIKFEDLGEQLKALVLEENPLYEDIAILDSKGEMIAAIIPENLYKFLQEKVEEAEDEIDNETVREFHEKGE